MKKGGEIPVFDAIGPLSLKMRAKPGRFDSLRDQQNIVGPALNVARSHSQKSLACDHPFLRVRCVSKRWMEINQSAPALQQVFSAFLAFSSFSSRLHFPTVP
jgi:hypothetical protein